MADKTNIPQGYRDSLLGIIPKDWEVKRLGDVCDIDKQSLSSSTDPEYEFYYISLSDVNSERFEIRSSRQVFKTAPSRARRIIKKGDVVISTVRPNLQAFIFIRENVKDVIVSTGFAVLTPKKILGEYLFHYLFSQSVTKQFYQLVVGSNYPAVNSSDVYHLKISVPPYIEQQGIVSVISLWNTAIEKQSELIEQLKLRKHALMQQLLTGKKRLPGFKGEWVYRKLGDVCTFLSNNTLSREQLNQNSGTISDIHYGDVLIKYPTILDCEKERIPYIVEDAYNQSMTDFVKDGDIVMSDTAEDFTVGRACEIHNVGKMKILAGLHTFLFRPNVGLFSPYFLGYYINSEAYHKQLISLIQGIKVCSIGKTAIKKTILAIPPFDEQKEISTILRLCDIEIEKVRLKRDEIITQKRGLMQQLLTGNKRII